MKRALLLLPIAAATTIALWGPRSRGTVESGDSSSAQDGATGEAAATQERPSGADAAGSSARPLAARVPSSPDLRSAPVALATRPAVQLTASKVAAPGGFALARPLSEAADGVRTRPSAFEG